MFCHSGPQTVKFYSGCSEYRLEGLVTNDIFAGIKVVSPGVGVDAGQCVLGVNQELPAHQLGQAPVQLVDDGEAEVVSRGDLHAEGHGEAVLGRGYTEHGGEGVTVAVEHDVRLVTVTEHDDA